MTRTATTAAPQTANYARTAPVAARCASRASRPTRVAVAAAAAAYGALLDAAGEISTSGVVAIGAASGPRPFDPREST